MTAHFTENKFIINNEKIFIKKLELKDAFEIKKWGSHNNELLIDYDLGKFNLENLKIWYSTKKTNILNKYFAIYINNKMIGYIGIKEINYLKKSSVLGLVLDPNFVSKGYGFKIMRLFFKYYFEELKMKSMSLDVNEFNERAIKLYEKLGFKYFTEYLAPFENQYIDFQDEKYKKYKDNFVIHDEIIYSRIYTMKLNYRRYQLMETEYEI